jgi:hypothetical protein
MTTFKIERKKKGKKNVRRQKKGIERRKDKKKIKMSNLKEGDKEK